MPWAEVTNPETEFEIWVRGRDKHIHYPITDPETGDILAGADLWTVMNAWISWPDIEDTPIELTGGNALTNNAGVIEGVVAFALFNNMPRGARSYLYIDVEWDPAEELLTIQVPIKLKKAPV